MSERFFAPCPRGLETALAAELSALGGAFVTPADGGVAFTGPIELAYRASLESRLAGGILWQVAHGGYRDTDELYALAKGVAWGRHFTVARTLRVDVAATRSPLSSIEFATLKVKDAVCDRFRADSVRRPSIDKERPDVRVHAYLTEREATLYLDTSGEALFKRGWRRDADVAPLRENLAAGVLALCGWAPGTPLLDRCAARAPSRSRRRSGLPTLRRGSSARRLSEAGLVRRPGVAAHPPARTRPHARSPGDTPDLRERRRPPRRSAVPPQRGGRRSRRMDRDRARSDVLSRPAPGPSGLLVANPPYGVRLDDEVSLAAFYPKLGDALKQRFAGWTAFLLTSPQIPGQHLHPADGSHANPVAVNLLGLTELHELVLDQIEEIALLLFISGEVFRGKGIERQMLDSYLQAPIHNLLRGVRPKAVP